MQTLAAGAAPTGTVVGREVTVHWDQVELSGGTPVGAYLVRRYSLGGVEQPVDHRLRRADRWAGLHRGRGPGGQLALHDHPGPGALGRAREPPSARSSRSRSAQLVLTGPTTITALPATLAGTVSGFIGDDPITFHLDSPTGPVLVGSPALTGPAGTAVVVGHHPGRHR